MILSCSKAHTVPCPDVCVCSLSWSDHPGQARLLPPTIHSDDGLDVPLRHATPLPCSRDRSDNKCSMQSNTNSTHVSVDDITSAAKINTKQNRMTGSREYSLAAPRTHVVGSRATLCASCEERAEASHTPEPPTVSPCSFTSSTSCDYSSTSTSPVTHMNMLLKEVTSRMPCIETGQSIMTPWTDIREVFFSRCSGPSCNIVLNALKLQLKYPHIPQYMHSCSQSEQMVFLKQRLHLVCTGTPLVDVEAFLKHRDSLMDMVETKHLVTADTRSIGCDYTKHHHPKNEWEQWEAYSQKQKPSDHLLPAVVTTTISSSVPGDATSPEDAMVPLSMLPVLFPRYQRKLLLMATGFITGKDKRLTRKCSNNEARLLNMWHCSIKGSNNQLITSSDLLVKWTDVVVIVDPLAKHTARVCGPQQQQVHQLKQQRSQAGTEGPGTRVGVSRINQTQSAAPTVHTPAQEIVVHHDIKEEAKEETSAENWMPQIVSCYSTTVTAGDTAATTASTEQTNCKTCVPQGDHEQDTCDNLPVRSATANLANKNSDIIPSTDVNIPSTSNKEGDCALTLLDTAGIFSTEVPFLRTCDSSSSSSCDSDCEFKPYIKKTARGKDVVTEKGLTKQVAEKEVSGTENCNKTHAINVTAVKTVSEEGLTSTSAKSKRYTYRSKPRKCKSSKLVRRRSERIAKQTKDFETSNLTDSDDEGTIARQNSQETLINEDDTEGKYSKTSETPQCINTPNSDAPEQRCKNSQDESILKNTSAFGTTGSKAISDTPHSHQNVSSHGYRNIADLFTVLSNEEVSHRSQQLANDEIVISMKKCAPSKTRPLGDLSCKGLDLGSQSGVRSEVQKPTPVSTKTNQKSDSAQRIGKNRNKYPEMRIEAQKYPVIATVSVPKKNQFVSQHPVSVTEIMKSMDKTFSAFKSDPVELIKEKMRNPENPSGYVNTDYIQITNPREKRDRVKSKLLPPLNILNDDSTKREVKFSSDDISTILRSQDPKQNSSILDQNSSLPLHEIKKRDSKTVCQEQPPSSKTCSKPQWNLNKVLSASVKTKHTKPHKGNDNIKTKMDKEFQKMRAKALGKPPTLQFSDGQILKSDVNELQQSNEHIPLSTSKVTGSLTKDKNLKTASSVEPIPCLSVGEDSLSEKQQDRSGRNAPEEPCKLNINTVSKKSEMIMQSKKRQKLEDKTEKGSNQPPSNEPVHSNITAYWSGFPVGQTKDSLTNYRYGKSRYPIDSCMPPPPSPTQRAKRNQSCNKPSECNAQLPTNTADCASGADILPSYMNWGRPINPVRPQIKPVVMSNSGKHDSSTDARSIDRILHSRSFSADRFQFLIQNDGKQLSVPNTQSFNSSNLSTDKNKYHLNSVNLDPAVLVLQSSTPNFYKPAAQDRSVTEVPTVNEQSQQKVNGVSSLPTSRPTPVLAIPGMNAVTKRVLSSSDGTNCAQSANNTQRYLLKSDLYASPGLSLGPFHDRARVEAGGNGHNIRHFAGLANQAIQGDSMLRVQAQVKSKKPLELPNGECMVWNDTKKMWFINKNRNSNCSEAADGNTQNITAPLDHIDGKKSKMTTIFDSDRKTCQTSETDANCSLSDVDELLSSTVSSFLTLRKCLSTAETGGNSNNNCNDDEEGSNRRICERGAHAQLVINSAKFDDIVVPTVNPDFHQPVYPSYGAMIKDEPVKKNILLRETLKNNFFLIKEISKCVCTCRDIIMSSRPGEKMHYKKFLKKRYLESVRHCPLHSEDTQYLIGFQSKNEKQEQSGKSKTKKKVNVKRKGRNKNKNPIPTYSTERSWFSDSEPRHSSKSVREQCLHSTAKEYLASYVNQHYKKELLGRYQSQELDVSEGDHLYTDFFTFIEKSLHRNVKGNSRLSQDQEGTDSKQTGDKNTNRTVIVDRHLKRHLHGNTSTVTQQKLFMQILKKTQKSKHFEEELPRSSDNPALIATGPEGSCGGVLCRLPSNEPLIINNQSKSGSCAVENISSDCKPNTKANTPQQPDGSQKLPQTNISYDELFSNDHPDVSYCGVAYVCGLALPYVVHNGYKFLPVKQATRLLPRCCCSYVRSMLKKHSSLSRTLCTWEQVSLLNSLCVKKNRTVQTGDILIRLDTLVLNLPTLEEELKIKHQYQHKKTGLTCLY